MNISGVMDFSLGEWSAICRKWFEAHQGEKKVLLPPTDEEFEQAILNATAH